MRIASAPNPSPLLPRDGQTLTLASTAGGKPVEFVVVESSGGLVSARSTTRTRAPFAVQDVVRVRVAVLDDGAYEGVTTLLTYRDADGHAEYCLELPANMERTQNRDFRRLALLGRGIAATLTETDRSRAYEGRLVDISAGGAAVVAPARWRVGTRLKVQCQLDASVKVDCLATVVRIHPADGRYGLRFTGLRPAMQDKIVAYVLRRGATRAVTDEAS